MKPSAPVVAGWKAPSMRTLERLADATGHACSSSFAPRTAKRPAQPNSLTFAKAPARVSTGWPSLFLSLAEESLYELFRLDFKGIADAKQGDERGRASGLDHLPMAHAESVGNHVLLAKFAFRPV